MPVNEWYLLNFFKMESIMKKLFLSILALTSIAILYGEKFSHE